MVHKPVKEMTKMERWLAYFANKLNQKESFLYTNK